MSQLDLLFLVKGVKMNCPKCQKTMLSGYSAANTGLSWIDEDKFKSFTFIDTDLSGAGLKKLLPWKGEYFRASNCAQCKIMLIDYSERFDRKAVESKMRK
jgi:predicted nucleic-acid-binding Zn-ribbon protein